MQIKKTRILIVEGLKSDKPFFEAFLLHKGIADVVQVVAMSDGKSSLRPTIRAVLASSRGRPIEALGIVRDADADAGRTLQSLQSSVRNESLPVPDLAFEFAEGAPRIGLAILPDGDSRGELEDLCLRTIEGEPWFHCIATYMECMRSHGEESEKEAKSHIAARLSALRNPELTLGESAKAGAWDFDHPELEQLADFLVQLAS